VVHENPYNWKEILCSNKDYIIRFEWILKYIIRFEWVLKYIMNSEWF